MVRKTARTVDHTESDIAKMANTRRGGRPCRRTRSNRNWISQGAMTGFGQSAEAMRIGDMVTVLYSPERPKRSLLYALTDFKAVAVPAKSA